MATKQEIADVFEKHVSHFGYSKTSLDEVARVMHISKKTIYVHFAGKREIYRYIVAQQAELQRSLLKASVAELPTCRAKVEALMKMVVAQARGHIAETTETDWLQEYEVAADAFRQANGDVIREMLAAGMANGEFPAGDAALVEKMIAAMVVEYVVMVNSDRTYDRDEELVERIMRFIG